MKLVLAVLVTAVLSGLAWGFYATTQPVPERGEVLMPVDTVWERTLPVDPDAATAAVLDRMTPTARARGNALSDSRVAVFFLRIAILIGSFTLLLFTGTVARMRDRAQRLSSHVPLQDALVAAQLLAALFVLNLPLDTYAGFIRYRQAGLSHAAFAQWLRDAAVNWAVLSSFYVVGIVVIMALIRRRPRTWVPWATAVYVLLSGLYTLIAPNYIEPLFNRISPLGEGPAKTAILSLARANGVPVRDVYVRDASRQSELLDAHVTGLGGTARIVLDDNTIARTPLPEVLLVMGHEIGHYVLRHLEKGIVFDGVVMGMGFLLIAWALPVLLGRFGRRWRLAGPEDPGTSAVLWFLFLFWGFLSQPITASIAREQESEADLYGLNASQESIAGAMFMIRAADIVRLDPSALEECVFYTHPSPRNRIFTMMRWRAERFGEGGVPNQAAGR